LLKYGTTKLLKTRMSAILTILHYWWSII